MRCMDAYMIDKTPSEKEAMNVAMAAAGRFIETTGKYNFLEFTPDQFDEFIECIITAYVNSLQAQLALVEPPQFP